MAARLAHRCVTGPPSNLQRRDYLHLPPLRRGRRAGLPRRRRARRALAMAWWARGGAAWHARPPRRAIPADSTTSPNSPATPREHSFGCSRPTRRPCAILVGPAPCPSRRAPPPATRLARGFASWSYDVHARFVRFLTPRLPTRRANGAHVFPRRPHPCPRREVRAWERGTPVSAGRIHDAARERRTPWSVTPDWSSGCPDPRRSTGHNLLLHPLGAIPPRWPQPRIAGQSTSTRTDYMPPASASLSRGWQAAS